MRYGLIGTGMMGVEHLNNLAITPGAVVTAIADPVDTSLQWARKALGEDRAAGVTAFADAAALATSGLVDAVIVASPNHTHREVLAPLFGEGIAILCEKPLATTIEDARWIVEQAEKSDRPFWTAMEYRYMPPAAAFIAEVHGGRVGDLRMLSIREHRFPVPGEGRRLEPLQPQHRRDDGREMLPLLRPDAAHHRQRGGAHLLLGRDGREPSG